MQHRNSVLIQQRRYLVAIALVFAAGCRERERFPEPERERPRPSPVVAVTELDCTHGLFCPPVSPSAPVAPAAAPHDDCESMARIPAEAAKGVSLDKLSMLRVRFDEKGTAEARAKGEKACCYFWFEHCRGRPLLVRGRPRLAKPRVREDWAPELGLDAGELDPGLRERLSAHWLREAAYEHASIAAFERFTADLMELSAPADLVEASQRAAKDEARHARLAYGLASAYAGRRMGPGELRLPRRARPSLARLAASTYVEGCASESVAAALVREAAFRARDPRLASWLSEVARDEEEHARLAWRTVAWALCEGGVRVERAVKVAARRVEAGAFGEQESALDEGSELEVFGVLGARSRRASAERAYVDIVVPCTKMLFGDAV